MERENVQLVDDNCSQIEVAFKRMKVGTRRCTDAKNHRHIYNRSNHYQHSPQSNHHHQHQQQQQQQLSKQIVQQPDLQSNSNRVSSTPRVNPYYNQIFSPSTRVISNTHGDDTLDRIVSVDGKDPISFSSFSASPLALINNFPSSSTNTFSSSSSPLNTSSSAVTPPLDSYEVMGPYRDVALREGQTDTSHRRTQFDHHQNQIQNDNNHHHHLNQSNDHTKYEDGPPADLDVSVEELAAYLDVQLYIPRKMSYMAELMYT